MYTDTFTVTRSRMRRGNYFQNYYETVGPDGAQITNASITTLRNYLKSTYGRDIKIIETWKEVASR